jgi:hypothetical protein
MDPLVGVPWLKCPVCGYDLRGLSENRCPECGKSFDPTKLQITHETQTRETLSVLAAVFGAKIFISLLVFLILGVPFVLAVVENSNAVIAYSNWLRCVPFVLLLGLQSAFIVLFRDYLKRLNRSQIPRMNIVTVIFALVGVSPLVLSMILLI